MRLVFVTSAAKADILEASEWYRAHSSTAATDFQAEVVLCVSRVERNPTLYPIFHGKYRRAVFHAFPYLLVYQVSLTRILIVAVAHGKRGRRFWNERL